MVETNLLLLLVYKDNLTIGGERGFPLTIDSQTILEHYKMSKDDIPEIQKKNIDTRQLSLIIFICISYGLNSSSTKMTRLRCI